MQLIWDGEIWENSSFAVVNRNMVRAPYDLGVNISLDAWGQGFDKAHKEHFKDKNLLLDLSNESKYPMGAVTIRQSWPKCDPYYDPAYNWRTIKGAKKVGWLAWESEHLPQDWLPQMKCVDLICTVSPFSRYLMRTELENNYVHVPVHAVPHGVDRRIYNSNVTPLFDAYWPEDIQKTFKFLHLGVGQPRKGSDILLSAYRKEFGSSDNVVLVVKTGGFDYPEFWLKDQTQDSPRIFVVHENTPESEIPRFYASCDCLVHPARSEGFGMTMLEAMACGCHVICTDAGGHTCFANKNNAILIDCKEVQFEYFNQTGTAFEANEDHLRKEMRKVYENVEYKKHTITAGLDTAGKFSWERSAKTLLDVIRNEFHIDLLEDAFMELV